MSRQELIPLDYSSALTDRERIRCLRREEAEAHRYKTIWTKEPHGGEYRAIEATPQKVDQVSEPGYEVVEVGPTTNFVGNHMTQAAIDLVQADLQTSLNEDLQTAIELSRGAQLQPLRIERAARSDRARVSSIERYGWYDCGAYIKLEISMERPIAEAECAFGSRSVSVALEDSEGHKHQLRLSNLTAALEDGASHWFTRGSKLFVMLVKENNVPWDRLCAECPPSAMKAVNVPETSLESIRRQVLQRGNTASLTQATKNSPQGSYHAAPLTKVARRVHEEELVSVEKLGNEGVKQAHLGDACAAFEASNRALEEVKRLASENIPHWRLSESPASSEASPAVAARNVPPDRLFAISADLHHRMAQCRMQTGQLKEALHLCTASIKELQTSRSDNADLMAAVLLTRAQAFETLEDYKGAHCDFREVLKYSRNRQASDGVRRVQRLARNVMSSDRCL